MQRNTNMLKILKKVRFCKEPIIKISALLWNSIQQLDR